MILTLDLGTTRTKAVLWDEDGAVATGDARLATSYPAPGRAEQDAAQWWPAVVSACTQAGAASPAGLEPVEAVVFAAARQTFVPVAADGSLLGPGLLWSDRRGGGTVGGKWEWLCQHEPSRMAAARWALSPRDLVLWRLTGTVVTDTTLLSAAGDGPPVPPAVEPATVVGPVVADAAAELGVPASAVVVAGGGDRQCEVLGTAAAEARPMASWGTTANVSVPVASDIERPPLVRTRGALGGWLLEGGLAAAGSLLDWVSGLTGRSADALAAAAAASPPGARGVTCLPWLGGARAPWWRDAATAAFLGIGPSHTAGDLARAAFEAVAFDLARCIEVWGGPVDALALAGGDTLSPWVEIVTAVTGVPGIARASRHAACVGALLVAMSALGGDVDVERRNPVASVITPATSLVDRYAEVRAVSDATVAAGLALAEVGP